MTVILAKHAVIDCLKLGNTCVTVLNYYLLHM